MPVQIGAKAHDVSDPTGFLSDCHRRIEMFLGILVSVGAVIDRPLTDEGRKALEAALRYFRLSAPKHNADEEESLFPRMRRMSEPEIQQALGRLDELEKEHRWAEPLHAEIDRLGQACLTQGALDEREAVKFRQAAADLAAMYREHIRVEDETVFPLAAKWLVKEEQLAIGREMAARRSR